MPRLQSLTRQSLVVAPIRLALGGLGFAVAAAAEGADVAGLGFVFGAVGLLVAIAGDPRVSLQRGLTEVGEAPAEAREDDLLRVAGHAVFPSTVGATVLMAIALPTRPVLGAVLAGVLFGLGLAALTSGYRLVRRERLEGVRLYEQVRSGRIVARPVSGRTPPDAPRTTSRPT